MMKWDRKRPTKRQRAALERATGMGRSQTTTTPVSEDARDAGDEDWLIAWRGQRVSLSALFGDSSSPTPHRTSSAGGLIDQLLRGESPSLGRDALHEVSRVASAAFKRTDFEDDALLLANPEAAPLLRYFLCFLLRYEAEYGELRSGGGAIAPQAFRKTLEESLFLTNRRGSRGLAPEEMKQINDAFDRKFEAVLGPNWVETLDRYTQRSIDRARQAAFEAAYFAHYKRPPRTGDGDKDNVDLIRRVLGTRLFPQGGAAIGRIGVQRVTLRPGPEGDAAAQSHLHSPTSTEMQCKPHESSDDTG